MNKESEDVMEDGRMNSNSIVVYGPSLYKVDATG
jgi:hypothetical protein